MQPYEDLELLIRVSVNVPAPDDADQHRRSARWARSQRGRGRRRLPTRTARAAARAGRQRAHRVRDRSRRLFAHGRKRRRRTTDPGRRAPVRADDRARLRPDARIGREPRRRPFQTRGTRAGQEPGHRPAAGTARERVGDGAVLRTGLLDDQAQRDRPVRAGHRDRCRQADVSGTLEHLLQNRHCAGVQPRARPGRARALRVRGLQTAGSAQHGRAHRRSGRHARSGRLRRAGERQQPVRARAGARQRSDAVGHSRSGQPRSLARLGMHPHRQRRKHILRRTLRNTGNTLRKRVPHAPDRVCGPTGEHRHRRILADQGSGRRRSRPQRSAAGRIPVSHELRRLRAAAVRTDAPRSPPGRRSRERDTASEHAGGTRSRRARAPAEHPRKAKAWARPTCAPRA